MHSVHILKKNKHLQRAAVSNDWWFFVAEKEMIQMKQQNTPPVLRRVRRLDSIRQMAMR